MSDEFKVCPKCGGLIGYFAGTPCSCIAGDSGLGLTGKDPLTRPAVHFPELDRLRQENQRLVSEVESYKNLYKPSPIKPMDDLIDDVVGKTRAERNQLAADLHRHKDCLEVARVCLRELKVRIAYIGMPQEDKWSANGAMVPDWRKQIALLESTTTTINQLLEKK